MTDLGGYDWSKGTAEDQLEMARRSSPEELCNIACIYDWGLYPEDVLGWVMAQKCIDLGSALNAFLNGEPERFNYMPKRDVPDCYRPAARLLDNICLRVNSGYYLTRPGMDVKNKRRLERWLAYQEIDREEGHWGRWILDEAILRTLDEAQDIPDTVAMPDNSNNSLLKDVLSPLKDLGVSREYLKYLPSEH